MSGHYENDLTFQRFIRTYKIILKCKTFADHIQIDKRQIDTSILATLGIKFIKYAMYVIIHIHMYTHTLLAVMQYTLIITYNLHFGVLALSFYHYLSQHIPLSADAGFLFSKFVQCGNYNAIIIIMYVYVYLHTLYVY